VSLIDKRNNTLEILMAHPKEKVREFRQAGKAVIDLNSSGTLGIAERVAITGEYVNAPNIDRHPDYIPFPPGYNSHLSIPLKVRGQAIGVLTVESKKRDAFTDEDVLNLRFMAGLAAAPIEKTELLERAAKLLERANKETRAREDYIGDVTHQLVGPLSGIRAWCEHLIEVKMIEEFRASILRRVFNQAGLVQRYALNFVYAYQLEQKMGESSIARAELIKPARLVQLLIEYAESFQGETTMRSIKGPSIEGSSFQNFPLLHLDLHLFEMLILNLYDNAVKYSYDKQIITVVGRVLDKTAEIEITNYGIPLEEKDLERLFERGERSDVAIEFAPTGTGIGLFISRSIARLHGGELKAVPSPTTRRKEGNEVKFIVSLPIPVENR